MAWQRAFADMKVIAIMIVRNEEAYLSRCLAYLKSQGLRAAVIDNGSTDSTPSILASHQPDTVVHVEHVPFNGMFEWEALLKHAHAMQAKVDADWVHLNSADEMCSGTRPGERLLDAIKRVDAEGYDAINYEEFVFPPDQLVEALRGQGVRPHHEAVLLLRPQPSTTDKDVEKPARPEQCLIRGPSADRS